MKTQKPYYITTEKISVGYDGKPLIEEVEIALRKGEILTLLGPNGAGKSTILKSIARQLSLIAGTVRLDGEDMRTLTGAELSKKMAVVMTKFLRGELVVDVGTSVSLVNSQNGLIYTEGIYFTGTQCGGDCRVVIILLERDSGSPQCGIKGICIKAAAIDQACIDHSLYQCLCGSGSGGYTDLLVYQVCQGADAALILYQYGYIVCKIRSGEIPALLSLIGDGESSQYTVNIAGIQKLGSGSCGYSGELYIHAKALCDLLSQADLQSGILTGQGILEAKAYYCIFNADSQYTTVYDCLYVCCQLAVCCRSFRSCFCGCCCGTFRCRCCCPGSGGISAAASGK